MIYNKLRISIIIELIYISFIVSCTMFISIYNYLLSLDSYDYKNFYLSSSFVLIILLCLFLIFYKHSRKKFIEQVLESKRGNILFYILTLPTILQIPFQIKRDISKELDVPKYTLLKETSMNKAMYIILGTLIATTLLSLFDRGYYVYSTDIYPYLEGNIEMGSVMISLFANLQYISLCIFSTYLFYQVTVNYKRIHSGNIIFFIVIASLTSILSVPIIIFGIVSVKLYYISNK